MDGPWIKSDYLSSMLLREMLTPSLPSQVSILFFSNTWKFLTFLITLLRTLLQLSVGFCKRLSQSKANNCTCKCGSRRREYLLYYSPSPQNNWFRLVKHWKNHFFVSLYLIIFFHEQRRVDSSILTSTEHYTTKYNVTLLSCIRKSFVYAELK